MGVGDDQLDPCQAPGDQATQERRPARAILRTADVQPDQLPVAVGVDRGRHQHRGVADPPSLTDLHAHRVDPHKRVRAGDPAAGCATRRPARPGSAQLRETCEVEICSIPMERAMSSTRRVDTPST